MLVINFKYGQTERQDMAHLSPNIIRARFAQAMSDMYQTEVPLYGDLISLVQDVNQAYLAQHPDLASQMAEKHDHLPSELDRLNEERHGAIRVGTAQELSTLRRLFNIMGMQPVSYYDLSVAGIPVHSTAFRATHSADLQQSPFRIFTSLLRLDLIEDPALRAQAQETLSRRNIFTADCLTLIDQHDQQGGLTDAQATQFITEALETFRWHQEATVTPDLYQKLHDTHRLIADIVCFKGPHINHLTPRTLDIDSVQTGMSRRDIPPKLVLEGPPLRQNPILLRQTSFKALKEHTLFLDETHSPKIPGHHTARFGEIEQRGQALTPKGRGLYDQFLNQVMAEQAPKADGSNLDQYYDCLSRVFAEFPDDETEIRIQKLGYFHYRLTDLGQNITADSLTEDMVQASSRDHFFDLMISAGYVRLDPIIYEDFLPVSAAGIFRSNLDGDANQAFEANPNQAAFEQDLGARVLSEFELYAQMESKSQEKILSAFGLAPKL